MGITSKPVGKMKSIMKKLDNELFRKAQEEKEKKEKKGARTDSEYRRKNI